MSLPSQKVSRVLVEFQFTTPKYSPKFNKLLIVSRKWLGVICSSCTTHGHLPLSLQCIAMSLKSRVLIIVELSRGEAEVALSTQ